MGTWETAIQVRVKEQLYTEFKQAVRKFTRNKNIFKGKYIPKIWDVEQTMHNEEYLTLQNLAGAYIPYFFHKLKVRKESNIFKRLAQMYKENSRAYSNDTHDQSVNYVFHKSDQIEYIDPVEAVADGGLYDDDSDITEDAACYSGMSGRFNTAIGNGFDMVTGYFYLDTNITYARAIEFVELCRKWGMLSPLVETRFDEDHIVYSLYLKSKNVRYDKLYFQFSLLRFLLEYHGTLNIMFDLRDQFKLCMPLALVLAMQRQPNKRWLHVPWTTADNPMTMTTAVAYARAIMKFRPGQGLFDKLITQFKSSPAIDRLACSNVLDHVQNLQDARDVKTLNSLIMEVFVG